MKVLAAFVLALIGLAGAVAAAPTQVMAGLLPPAALQRLEDAQVRLRGVLGGASTSTDLRGSNASGEPSFKLAEAQMRPIADVISTTGTLTPMALVAVSSLVSGQVKELHADFNADVKKGDALATFDPVSFQNALTGAEADLAIAQASVVKAQINLREAEADVQRKRTLFSSGAGALTDQSKSIAARDLAAANLQEATATVKKAEAAVGEATTSLARATIRSPITGTIINRNVEIGQVLAVSLAVPTLFTIAKDLRAMQLDALVSEGDIGRVRVGQRVTFSVDTYPDRIFEGDVAQIRKQPQSSQNVVLYTVIVDAPNPERLLLPGMTATTRIIIDERPPALAVPNAALRVKVSAGETANPSRLFVDRDGHVTPVSIKSLGGDSAFTQIESRELRAGDRVVVGLLPRGTKPPPSRRLVGGF